jgi:hypothetical protein
MKKLSEIVFGTEYSVRHGRYSGQVRRVVFTERGTAKTWNGTKNVIVGHELNEDGSRSGVELSVLTRDVSALVLYEWTHHAAVVEKQRAVEAEERAKRARLADIARRLRTAGLVARRDPVAVASDKTIADVHSDPQDFLNGREASAVFSFDNRLRLDIDAIESLLEAFEEKTEARP